MTDIFSKTILYSQTTVTGSANNNFSVRAASHVSSAAPEIKSCSQGLAPTPTRLYSRIFLTFLLLISISSFAQQTVRGRIIDLDSKQPLAFAGIRLIQGSSTIGTTSDIDGNFVLQNVPIGQQSFSISSIGYESKTISNVKVTAGREIILQVELLQVSNELEEVIVTAETRERTVNSMASVSAKSLNMEEANRYAGSFGDPARQVLNFAGVSSTGGDLSNEIVVRGNSPNTTLWRLEGIEIPNPNHFATYPGTGGAVSMLSSNVLATSDFFTSAYPAEYGNATGGVFDLRSRTGNAYKRETTLDLGALGLGIMTEGPIGNKSNSSYLVNYRYSTLAILEAMGLEFSGGTTSYQDLNFNINLSTKKHGTFTLFGLYGSNSFKDDTGGFDTYIGSSTTIAGIKHTLALNNKSFLQSSIGYTQQRTLLDDSYGDVNQVFIKQSDDKAEALRFTSFVNTKFTKKFTLKTGFIVSEIMEDVENVDKTVLLKSQSNVVQLYSQGKYRISNRLSSIFGLHYYSYSFTNKTSIEPRLAFNYDLNEKHRINIGTGLHSRAMRLSTYALTNSTENQPNRNLNLSKSLQVVMGHDWEITESIHLKTEVYYQYLYDLVVDTATKTAVINNQTVFESLEDPNLNFTNQGIGRNYGIEFTFDQSLQKGLYYFSTLSLFQSNYKVTDSDWFNTRFNQNYVFNLLIGKEFVLGSKKTNTLSLNIRFNTSGGQRYSTINIPRSINQQRVIYDPLFTEQSQAYWRIDFGINYQWNKKKTSSRISLDIQNISNRENVISNSVYYDGSSGELRTETSYGNGLVPIIRYTFSF